MGSGGTHAPRYYVGIPAGKPVQNLTFILFIWLICTGMNDSFNSFNSAPKHVWRPVSRKPFIHGMLSSVTDERVVATEVKQPMYGLVKKHKGSSSWKQK